MWDEISIEEVLTVYVEKLKLRRGNLNCSSFQNAQRQTLNAVC